MKRFLILLAVLCPTLVFGQAISYRALNLSQFYSNAYTVNIKTNAIFYGFTNTGNANILGDLVADGIYGLMGSGDVTNAAGSRVAYLSDVGGGGIQLITGTANPNVSTTSRYGPFGLSQNIVTAEANVAARVIASGFTLTNLWARWSTIGAGTNFSITAMTNGVASHYAVSVNGTGAAVEQTNTVDSLTVPAGTLLSWRFLGDNAANGIPFIGLSVELIR